MRLKGFVANIIEENGNEFVNVYTTEQEAKDWLERKLREYFKREDTEKDELMGLDFHLKSLHEDSRVNCVGICMFVGYTGLSNEEIMRGEVL